MNPFTALLAGVAGVGAVLMIAALLAVCFMAAGVVFVIGFLVVGAITGSAFAGVVGGIFFLLLAVAMMAG